MGKKNIYRLRNASVNRATPRARPTKNRLAYESFPTDEDAADEFDADEEEEEVTSWIYGPKRKSAPVAPVAPVAPAAPVQRRRMWSPPSTPHVF